MIFVELSIPEMTRFSNALESEHHMPVMNSLVLDDFTPGMCCSAQTLFCNGQHQRRLGNRTLETNPHTLAPFLHGGWYGHLHAWETCITWSGCDHGCSRCFNAVCRGIHRSEDPVEFAAFLPADGRQQATFSHDQYQYWTASFQTSHAGKEMSLLHDTLGRSMGAPEFLHLIYCELTPAKPAGRRELIIRSKRS